MEIYGVHAVEEALEMASGAQTLWVDRKRMEDKRLKQCLKGARKLNLVVRECDRVALDKLARGGKHQGVVLVVAEFAYETLEGLKAKVGDRTSACVLVLDQVHDVGNLGAIARSAAAFEVDAIILAKDRSAAVTAAAIRASAGQLWRVPVIQVVNIARTLEDLQSEGFWFWATGVSDDPNNALWDAPLDGKVGIVMGSEHEGVRRLVRKRCDHDLWIPTGGGVESLNVSAASAVILAEVYRRRLKKSE